ncbi:MAG: S41 family peptidase, partial [Planctomycetota bacterium]
EPLSRGLGFDWRHSDDGKVLITRVVRGSPAAQHGFHVGMILLAINDLDPAHASRRQVAEALARSGESVRLRVRPLIGEASVIELQRAELEDDGIAAVRTPVAGIAMIRIGRFLPSRTNESGPTAATTTADGLRRAIASIPDVRAIVLDLRGCSGGNLQAAVECAASWAPAEAAIVEQVARDPAKSRTWSATAPRLPRVPIIVVVDGGTASSAEVLAHALRFHLRSPIVGAPTMGKGTVQQLFLLPHGDALRLTVARLRAPSDAWLDQPLQPDVLVAQSTETTLKAWINEGKTDGATVVVEDQQLARAIELATALAVREGK